GVTLPGGILVSTREHVVSSVRQLERFRSGHPLHHLYGGENAHRLGEYLASLRSAGFNVLRTVRPFDSVVNYAPFTRDTLRNELQRRLAIFSGGALVGRALESGILFSVALRILLRVERRPVR